MELAEPLAVALEVGEVLDSLGVAWLVGGSVASSLHGVPRSTQDVVVQKLDWFRRGGAVSERQWRDVLGVLQVSGDRLDLVYLRDLAGELGLTELLDRALQDSRL